MQLTLLTVGKRMPEWINAGVQEYIKRFPPEFSVKIIEISPGKRGKNTPKEKVIKEEALSILSGIPKNNYVIALDERGKQFDTVTLSKKIETWMQNGMDITFVIGGADGLDSSVTNSADSTWSLSSFTLPHALVRVFLVEQLYRAWSILKNHPYHRE